MSFRARSRAGRIPAAIVVLALALAAARPAKADIAVQCIEATDRGQQLRDEGKLVMAKQALATCSAAACPAIVRRDCAKWLADVEDRLPTIIVSARDEAGRDIAATRVVIDGKIVTQRLDGKELPIDPGEHRLHFEPEGYPAVDQTIVAREREKGRVVAIRAVGGTSPTPPPPVPPPPGPSPAPAGDSSAIPPLAFVAGGVAVLGIAGFVYFYASGVSLRDELRDTCAGSCTADQVSDVKTKNTLAFVSGGVGILAAAAAVGLIVLRPGPGKTASIAPLPGGGLASVALSF